MKVPKILQSSTGSGKLAARYQGVVIMMVSMVMLFAQFYGWDVRESDVEAIISLTVLVGGFIVHLFGLVRAFYYQIKRK